MKTIVLGLPLLLLCGLLAGAEGCGTTEPEYTPPDTRSLCERGETYQELFFFVAISGDQYLQGVNFLVNGSFIGSTDQTGRLEIVLSVRPNTAYTIRAYKTGYVAGEGILTTTCHMGTEYSFNLAPVGLLSQTMP
jgi:hypothetical protein